MFVFRQTPRLEVFDQNVRMFFVLPTSNQVSALRHVD
jgi:hypothetical protein